MFVTGFFLGLDMTGVSWGKRAGMGFGTNEAKPLNLHHPQEHKSQCLGSNRNIKMLFGEKHI